MMNIYIFNKCKQFFLRIEGNKELEPSRFIYLSITGKKGVPSAYGIQVRAESILCICWLFQVFPKLRYNGFGKSRFFSE